MLGTLAVGLTTVGLRVMVSMRLRGHMSAHGVSFTHHFVPWPRNVLLRRCVTVHMHTALPANGRQHQCCHYHHKTQKTEHTGVELLFNHNPFKPITKFVYYTVIF